MDKEYEVTVTVEFTFTVEAQNEEQAEIFANEWEDYYLAGFSTVEDIQLSCVCQNCGADLEDEDELDEDTGNCPYCDEDEEEN